MSRALILLTLLFSFLVAKDSFSVGVLYWSMNIEGQVAMREGLEREIERINAEANSSSKPRIEAITYVAGDGSEGIERQIGQFYELIGKGVDLIVVQPTDNAALIKPLLKANEKNIPVIAYDQYISSGELLSYVTSDNYQAGFLDGEYLSSLFPKKRKLRIVLVEYPHVSSTVERVEGFLDGLTKYGKEYDIVAGYKAVEPKSGEEAGKEIVKNFASLKPDIIFCVNDGGGYSVVQELQKAGIKDVAVGTIDGYEKSVDIIREDGLIKVDSAQFCAELGAVSIRKGYEYLMGKEIAKEILIPTFPVTKDSLEYYKGWLGAPPLEYKKGWFSYDPIWYYKLKVK